MAPEVFSAIGIEVSRQFLQPAEWQTNVSPRKVKASKYIGLEFGLYTNPLSLSEQHLKEAEALQEYMLELKDIARVDQQIVNISRRDQNNQNNGRSAVRDEAAQKFDEILRKVGELSIVNDHSMRAAFNGKVPMSGVSQKEKNISGALFLFTNKNLNYSTSRMLVEHSQRVLLFEDIGPTAWAEIAQKTDDIMSRLGTQKGERLMHQLPNWMRLLIYGQRMGVHIENDEYYQDIADQAPAVQTLDVLTSVLKRRIKDGGSDEEARAIVRKIMGISFLNDENGALRQRRELQPKWEQAYDSNVRRNVIFLLTAMRNVGVEATRYIYQYVDSRYLHGRGECGGVIKASRESFKNIVGPLKFKTINEKDAYEELERFVINVEDGIGHGA
jgi:hypothetical protein